MASTIRYFAGSRIPYARAVLSLVELAREGGDFSISPLDLSMMAESGLAVSGEDLSGPERVLDGIEGLVRTE